MPPPRTAAEAPTRAFLGHCAATPAPAALIRLNFSRNLAIVWAEGRDPPPGDGQTPLDGEPSGLRFRFRSREDAPS